MDIGRLDPDLLRSAFIRSWLTQAKPTGGLNSPVLSDRSPAWAQWFLEQATTVTGARDRSYPAVLLPGEFYDPRNTGALQPPHLEISQRVLRTADETFPTRLALMGNGLLAPRWIVPEVISVRKALFADTGTSVLPLAAALADATSEIHAHAAAIRTALQPHWEQVQQAISENHPVLQECVATAITPDEFTPAFQAARRFNLTASIEPGLRERFTTHLARRVGIWTVTAQHQNGNITAGTITPRLTRNSVLFDETLAPQHESPLANLVGVALLTRIAVRVAGLDPKFHASAAPLRGSRQPVLWKAMPAAAGARLPEASPESAARVVLLCADADDAWHQLTAWSASNNIDLMTEQEAFATAFEQIRSRVERAETPERTDIDTLLPIGWGNGRVIRVTVRHNI